MDNTLFESLTDGERRAIKEENEWLNEYRESYNEAVSNLKDQAKVRVVMKSVISRLEPVYTYDPKEDPGAVAPMILGRLAESFEGLLTDFHLVLTFEERLEKLRDYIANIEEQVRREQGADVPDHDQL